MLIHCTQKLPSNRNVGHRQFDEVISSNIFWAEQEVLSGRKRQREKRISVPERQKIRKRT